MSSTTPIRATCHCGAITVTVPHIPTEINHCQCSLCRRYGVAWGYYHPDEVKVEAKSDDVTKQYIWGDKGISFNFCGDCGCLCYWWPRHPPPAAGESTGKGDGEYGMGLNTNNMDPELLRTVDRKYDFAQLRQPLDAKDAKHPDDKATY